MTHSHLTQEKLMKAKKSSLHDDPMPLERMWSGTMSLQSVKGSPFVEHSARPRHREI